MRRYAPALLCAVLALWPASARLQDAPAAATDQANDARFDAFRQRFDGMWVLTVSEQEARRTVDGAIEQAVSAMNFFLRGVARPLLTSNTPLNRRIELRFRDRQRIYVSFDGRSNYLTPLDRTRRLQTHEGDPMNVTQRFRGETLEQVFAADQGTRWNVYTMLPNGNMRVDATTNGDMMPAPMHFALEYRRLP